MVVPLAGTWIEISNGCRRIINPTIVVPLAGTWIEIALTTLYGNGAGRRPPRGDVD